MQAKYETNIDYGDSKDDRESKRLLLSNWEKSFLYQGYKMNLGLRLNNEFVCILYETFVWFDPFKKLLYYPKNFTPIQLS